MVLYEVYFLREIIVINSDDDHDNFATTCSILSEKTFGLSKTTDDDLKEKLVKTNHFSTSFYLLNSRILPTAKLVFFVQKCCENDFSDLLFTELINSNTNGSFYSNCVYVNCVNFVKVWKNYGPSQNCYKRKRTKCKQNKNNSFYSVEMMKN